MTDRKARDMFSAVALVFVVLCSLALLSSAAAVAQQGPQPVAEVGTR
jgi:hypothetical protein